MTGLTRFDYGSTHGWFARHYEDGRVTSRLYSDRCYGDPEAARQAAQAFLAQLAQQRHPRVPFRTRLSRRNRTGVIGVCLRRKLEKNGASVSVYDVSYRLGSRRRTRTFRLHHYASRQAAFAAAVAFRCAMEAAMRHEAEAARNSASSPP